eukprot:8516320-Alexandrium_andersonii.AAC.1
MRVVRQQLLGATDRECGRVAAGDVQLHPRLLRAVVLRVLDLLFRAPRGSPLTEERPLRRR